MEGLVFTIALLIALAVGAGIIPRWRKRRQGPVQSTEPPGERSAPDDWPRDGGDNPRAP